MSRLTRFVVPALALCIVAGAATLDAQDLTKGAHTERQLAPPTAESPGLGTPAAGADRAAPADPLGSAAPVAGLGGTNTFGPYGADPASARSFDRFAAAGSIEYGVANNEGVSVSADGGRSWQLRNDGLPRREVYPFTNSAVETITALGVDPLDPERVAVTTALGLYVSGNAGRQWREVPLRAPIASVAYITAVALSPWSHETYAVGTSFSGIFETTDGGKSWKSYKEGLKFLYRGAGFYEEIAGLAYSPQRREVLFLGVDFGGGIYRSNGDRSVWTSLDFPAGEAAGPDRAAGGRRQVLESLAAGLEQGRPALLAATRNAYWKYDLTTDRWQVVGKPPAPPPIGRAKADRLARAAGRAGLYLAAYNATGDRLQRMIALAKRNGLNSFVVDVKDDFGRLTYDSQLPLAREMGAVHPFFNLRALIKTAHENGIYVIGRMVVFKDEPLYRYDGNKYAIWDRKTDAAWGEQVKVVDKKSGKTRLVQREFFVDPFSEGVWRYNVSIAQELQSLGIDEIQFDYIRFPSDGPLGEAEYRYRRPGMSRIDALESFMVMVREAIHIPISTDLYGFNCWYRMGNWIGQDLEMLANYVDAVCPMYYPSLFPPGFKEKVPYLERAKEIYQEGTRRAQHIVRGRADIRPFVQAFLLLDNEVSMDRTGYSDYLRAQLAGAKAARASGFTLWNAGNNYYMVTFPLEPYLPSLPREGEILR